MIWLTDKIEFPPVQYADKNGLLAIGGDLSVERLQLAYQSGIFPWYSEGDPILWYSPENRMVLFPKEIKVSKSMQSLLKKNAFHITYNQNFEAVISNCKSINRKDGLGTWITDEMKQAYLKLNKIGWAKSVEVWQEDVLVGGLYGVDLGNVFCGESMFSKVSNASKYGLIQLSKKLQEQSYTLIDCQIYNDHLASLGAREIPRNDFVGLLKKK